MIDLNDLKINNDLNKDDLMINNLNERNVRIYEISIERKFKLIE